MYERLVEALRNMDVSDACPCSVGNMCADQDCIVCQAADAIEELSKPKWIPVTEDSPKEWFPVLGAFKFQGGNGCIVTERVTINGEEIWSAAMGMKPFAWMPCPEPPKEET